MTSRDQGRPGRLAECLSRDKEKIVLAWERRVLADPKVPGANRLDEPLLRDHIPDFLDVLAEALEENAGRQDGERKGRKIGAGETSKAHARMRNIVGYNLDEALRELSHLRAAILEISLGPSVDGQSSLLLHTAIDRAMGEVAAELSRYRVDAERLARRNQEQFRLMVESIEDYAIFSTDTAGRISNWNPGVKRIFGYDEKEFMGKNVACIFTSIDIDHNVPQRELQKARAEGKAPDERWHQRKDGSLFWAVGVVHPLYEDDDRPVGFIKILGDRTKQKESTDALMRSEEHVRLAAEATGLGTWEFEPIAGTMTWSKQARKLFGFEEAEKITHERALAAVHPDDRQRVNSAIAEALVPLSPGR